MGAAAEPAADPLPVAVAGRWWRLPPRAASAVFQAWHSSWEPTPTSPPATARRGSPAAPPRDAQVRGWCEGARGSRRRRKGAGEQAGTEDEPVLSSVAVWHPWAGKPRTPVLAAVCSRPGSELRSGWSSSGMLLLPGRTITPPGEFFGLVTPRERDAAAAAEPLLPVPGGVPALLCQREVPLPRGRAGTGMCVSHPRWGHGGTGWDAVPVLPGRAG